MSRTPKSYMNFNFCYQNFFILPFLLGAMVLICASFTKGPPSRVGQTKKIFHNTSRVLRRHQASPWLALMAIISQGSPGYIFYIEFTRGHGSFTFPNKINFIGTVIPYKCRKLLESFEDSLYLLDVSQRKRGRLFSQRGKHESKKKNVLLPGFYSS